jgi:hypothetical protein
MGGLLFWRRRTVADIASELYSWSTTASSNSPSGATNVGSSLDDNLREIQAVVRKGLSHYNSVAVASAGTVDLGAQTGNFLIISGTTTITAFGTVSAGIWKVVRFSGALTLTHNGTSLILPGAANITTVAGDVACFLSEGSGNWRCMWYETVDGRQAGGVLIAPNATSPAQTAEGSLVWDTDDDVLTVGTGASRKTLVATAGGQTLTDKTLTAPTLTAPVINTSVAGTAVAGQSDMETPSSTAIIVTPAVVKNHPGVAKAWGSVNSAGTLLAGHAVTTAKAAVGRYTITFDGIAMSSANYAVITSVATAASGTVNIVASAQTKATGSFDILCQADGGLDSDIPFDFVVFGDL